MGLGVRTGERRGVSGVLILMYGVTGVRMMCWVDGMLCWVGIKGFGGRARRRGWMLVGMLTTNSRGEVATTFKVRGKKPSDRLSVWSSCCDDLSCRGLPTSQYQIVIGVMRWWRIG